MHHLSIVLTFLLLLMPVVPARAAGPATAPAKTQGILCAYWREIPGSRVEDLTSLAVYPGYPNEQVLLDRFEIPENQEGNFGTVIRGYIHPLQDGSYSFYIAGNNQCELWLSSDGTPEGKRLIASVPQWSMPQEWTASPEQQSKPVQLKQGGSYYIEARHKNGGGDNHLAVAWKLPDGTMQGPIPGKFLSPVAPVVVPDPVVTLHDLPVSAGRHRLQVNVDYLLQHVSIPVQVTLPQGYRAEGKQPAIVFLPDTDQKPDAEGFFVQGPDRLVLADPLLKFICISPQPPAGRNYSQRVALKAMAAVVREISNRCAIDGRHVGLTGVAVGGTAVWSLAMEMPGVYVALAPVNGRELLDPELAQVLRGTSVRIYTDIAEGFATGCANRMNEALANLDPKPQVIYLGEKELGKGPAADYCYIQPAFYDQLMGVAKPTAPAPAQPAHVSGRVPWIGGGLAVIGVVALVFYVRSRRSARQHAA